MEWPGKKSFNKVELEDLKLGGDGRKIGDVKSSGNFTFMRLHGGGHMSVPETPLILLNGVLTRNRVPLDQPEASLEFFNRWIGGEWM